MWIDHQCIKQFLGSSGELGDHDETGNNLGTAVLQTTVLGNKELFCNQIHAINERRDQAAISTGIQSVELACRHFTVNVHNRLMRRRGVKPIDFRDCLLDLLLHRLVLHIAFSLFGGYGNEDKDRLCVINSWLCIGSKGLHHAGTHTDQHFPAGALRLLFLQNAIKLGSQAMIMMSLPILVLLRLLEIAPDGCHFLRQPLGVVKALH
mmetsp:Transcript_11410/g.26365  ORF Transcript_11410/g.26365 Transcript_11410/m.26365 type:complete len:207 (-) Transcript_11410:1087-1707(-)